MRYMVRNALTLFNQRFDFYVGTTTDAGIVDYIKNWNKEHYGYESINYNDLLYKGEGRPQGQYDFYYIELCFDQSMTDIIADIKLREANK